MEKENVLKVIVICLRLQCVLGIRPFNLKSVARNVYDVGVQTTQNYLLATTQDREMLKLANMDTADFIRYFGYPCDTHEVITEDKYILTMHHIPHGKLDKMADLDDNTDDGADLKTNCTKPIVFLQHGLFSFSGDWFLSGPGKALGFLLADAGYDVWVGNARGNKHSRDHLTLDPNVDSAFWNFSWHEIGYYDIPAMIDHVLHHTKQERLFYIGHSQGNTVYYVMLSEHPQYNDKIIAQYSLSPIAFVTHLFGPMLRMLTYFEKFIKFSVDLLNIYEVKHDNLIFRYFFHKFCSTHFVQDLCVREIFSFVGYNPKQFNHTLLPLMLANYPAGCSIKQIKHFGQEVRSGNFEQYDYGYLGNMVTYGDHFPPSYNLENVKAPVYLFCSGNDYLSSLQDVKRLYWTLPDGKKHLWKVEDEMWNHVDYVWGIHAKELVYDKIMLNMQRYLKNENYCSIEELGSTIN